MDSLLKKSTLNNSTIFGCVQVLISVKNLTIHYSGRVEMYNQCLQNVEWVP